MPEGHGLTGLANVGNTCYLNSCLQALSHTVELHGAISGSGRIPSKLRRCTESLALVEWSRLREMMWSADCTIAPHGFVAALKRVASTKGLNLGIGVVQNDAQEFMQFLVECFHISLGREVHMTVEGAPQDARDRLAQSCYEAVRDMYKDEYSEMLPLFYGVHVSTVSATDGSVLSTHPEPFSVLSMPVPPNVKSCSLYACFDAYCAPSDLIGENQYETDDGRRVDARRTLFFWSLPKVMVVHIKRWGLIGHKDQRHVEAHERLDLSRYVKGYKPSSFVYDLYAVCNHRGGPMGGHYTAYVRPHGGDAWYEFNDTVVRRIGASSVVTADAYCLFYRKK
jgi:ubiquitin C-terminal hydrolase